MGDSEYIKSMQPRIKRISEEIIEVTVKKSCYSEVMISPVTTGIDILNHNAGNRGEIKGQCLKLLDDYEEVTLQIRVVSVKVKH